MVRVDFRHVHAVKKRLADGTVRTYYYHRHTRLRLPDDPTSPEFAQALKDLAPAKDSPEGVAPGSFAALVEAYLGSPEFRSLAPKTQRDYRRYLDVIRESWGRNPVRKVTREHVLALRDHYASRPRTANYVVSVLRVLLSYAVDRPSLYGLTGNPAARPKRLKTNGGHRPWEESEIAAFRAHWPLGSLERTAFELALNTGQRGGDIAAMARSHVKGGLIMIAQEKTGARVEVPISLALAEALAAWDTARSERIAAFKAAGRPVPLDMGSRVLTSPERGYALTVDYWRHLMIDAMQAVPGLAQGLGAGGVTTHGLRYTAATRLRELGLGWEDIGAITGHETAAMARKYSSRRRRAKIAIHRLDQATAEDTPTDDGNKSGPKV
ncbi:tyrosine-type recombinase/integrase [Roseospira marina]|uniref:Tyrosine-type recombinase/integrase n=1 Tax=Roseospira marina TaxID=140057 RepID=A0A5M6I7H6_9PROT|nr:tyrosine-type recombinase/integrase [Roseospira marina]KAA5603785.1 tyrosine-type recombinase/integrase [Roseospira marina]MBB4316088.1 integrase [Roseospira marina]MBB5089254.1 integrase [Roseospira marina]